MRFSVLKYYHPVRNGDTKMNKRFANNFSYLYFYYFNVIEK